MTEEEEKEEEEEEEEEEINTICAGYKLSVSFTQQRSSDSFGSTVTDLFFFGQSVCVTLQQALCSISNSQTLGFNLYNINEVIIQTLKYSQVNKRAFLGGKQGLRALFEARKGGRVRHI